MTPRTEAIARRRHPWSPSWKLWKSTVWIGSQKVGWIEIALNRKELAKRDFDLWFLWPWRKHFVLFFQKALAYRHDLIRVLRATICLVFQQKLFIQEEQVFGKQFSNTSFRNINLQILYISISMSSLNKWTEKMKKWWLSWCVLVLSLTKKRKETIMKWRSRKKTKEELIFQMMKMMRVIVRGVSSRQQFSTESELYQPKSAPRRRKRVWPIEQNRVWFDWMNWKTSQVKIINKNLNVWFVLYFLSDFLMRKTLWSVVRKRERKLIFSGILELSGKELVMWM